MLNISPIFDTNNRLKQGCLKKEWYVKNNLLTLYNDIFSHTDFLNEFGDITFRERIFYIQSNMKDVNLCKICNTRKLIFCPFKLKFGKRCKDISCKRKITSINSTKMHSARSDEKKKIIANKISKKLKGIPLTNETRRKLSISHTGKKQSSYTIQKRITSRKNNGVAWHSDESKQKNSISNKRTWNSPDYVEKRKSMFTNEVREKISTKIKNKILNGTFTPCITNTWTKWDAYVNYNGKIKKFRSNWEGVFWVLNPHLEYEKIRIPYEYNGKCRIYIVDFSDSVNKTLYEIKPTSQKCSRLNSAKLQFAKKWCDENNWNFIFIEDDWFVENAKLIDYSQHPNFKKSMAQFIWE